jgi:hypothetical protein
MGSSVIANASSVIANAYVIRAGKKPRWGTPNPTWRKEQFIQAAITADYPHVLPSDEPNHVKLTEAVNARLKGDPAFSAFREKYGSADVSRPAVIRAWRMLRRANA